MGSDLQTLPPDRRPTEISLTPTLRSLIEVATDFRYGRPAPPPREMVPEIRGAMVEIDRILEPAPNPEKTISARVTVLLSHYFVPDIPFDVQVAMLADWVDALRTYPWWAIEGACAEWLKNERRKPTPADIVEGCRAQTREASKVMCGLMRLLHLHESASNEAAAKFDDEPADTAAA